MDVAEALTQAAGPADIDAGTTMVRRTGPEVFRKILITGLGRSGTTALSSVFSELGYHGGNAPILTLGEDAEFQRMLLAPEPERLASELEAWAAKHEAVAWKEPKIFSAKGAGFLSRLPDDWLVVVVFRDPVAVVKRRVLSDGTELLPTLVHVANFQLKLAQFVSSIGHSVMLVSYEKLISSPEPTLGGLLPFVAHPAGLTDPSELWRRIIARREEYRSHELLGPFSERLS